MDVRTKKSKYNVHRHWFEKCFNNSFPGRQKHAGKNVTLKLDEKEGPKILD